MKNLWEEAVSSSIRWDPTSNSGSGAFFIDERMYVESTGSGVEYYFNASPPGTPVSSCIVVFLKEVK